MAQIQKISKQNINTLSILLIIISISLVIFKIYKIRMSFAELEIADEIINIGSVDSLSVIDASFHLKNLGPGKLYVKKIEAGCRCTDYEIFDTILNRGEETTLYIHYLPEMRGFFKKDVKLYTNSKESPILLTITGEVN